MKKTIKVMVELEFDSDHADLANLDDPAWKQKLEDEVLFAMRSLPEYLKVFGMPKDAEPSHKPADLLPDTVYASVVDESSLAGLGGLTVIVMETEDWYRLVPSKADAAMKLRAHVSKAGEPRCGGTVGWQKRAVLSGIISDIVNLLTDNKTNELLTKCNPDFGNMVVVVDGKNVRSVLAGGPVNGDASCFIAKVEDRGYPGMYTILKNQLAPSLGGKIGQVLYGDVVRELRRHFWPGSGLLTQWNEVKAVAASPEADSLIMATAHAALARLESVESAQHVHDSHGSRLIINTHNGERLLFQMTGTRKS